MKTAIIAASRTKYHKIHSNDSSKLDTEALKQELYNARKLKLETKLVSPLSAPIFYINLADPPF